MSVPKDRARDSYRQPDIEWTKQDAMQQKYAYELAHPPEDTYEQERAAAEERMK